MAYSILISIVDLVQVIRVVLYTFDLNYLGPGIEGRVLPIGQGRGVTPTPMVVPGTYGYRGTFATVLKILLCGY